MYIQSKIRLITSSFVALLLIAGVTFYIVKHGFKADTTGAFTISGSIYSPDRNEARPDITAQEGVSISLSSSTNPEIAPITTATDSSGSYFITAPSADFSNITITKDGYWDINGVISNYDDSGHFILNLALKSGFGQEDAQIFVPKFGVPNKFGISLEPFNSSLASLTKVTPQGETYTSTPIASAFQYFDQKTSDFIIYNSPQSTVENQMAKVVEIANDCAKAGGFDKVVRLEIQPYAHTGGAESNALLGGNQSICSLATVTGNYPKLPTGFYWETPVIRPFPDPKFAAVSYESGSASSAVKTLFCALSGCTPGADWGKVSHYSDQNTLYRGQTLSLMREKWPWNNEAIVVLGKAKTTLVAISTQTNKSVYMANPYMHNIKLSDFVVKDGDKEIDLKSAVDQGFIKNDMALSIPGSDTINPKSDNLDITIAPGEVISVQSKGKTFSLTPSHPVKLGGKVLGASNTALSDAEITFVSNDPNFSDSVSAKTDGDGNFSITSDDVTYDQALITKDGYQDTYIHLQNGGKISDITSNITLAPGVGTTRIEMIPVRNGITTTFGLSFSPDSKFSVQTTAPAGVNDQIKSFELNKGEFVPVEEDKFSVAPADQLEAQLSKGTAVYDSNNDLIYNIGGINQADNNPSTAIYAYSPSSTASQYVNDLPIPLSGASSVFIPAQNLVLIFGGKTTGDVQSTKVYGYYPETDKIFALDNLSGADQFNAISDGTNVYVFGQSVGSTKIYKVSLSSIATNLVSKNCYPKAAADCSLSLFNSPSSTLTTLPTGFAPYYSNSNNRIYFFGGTLANQPTADIYSVNSALGDFRKETTSLPFAVSDTASFSNAGKAYLFGGNITNNQTTDKGVLVQIDSDGKVATSELGNFKLNNATSSVAFAPDGLGNFFIFSSTAGLADPPPATPSYVQAIYPTATYKAGQVYSITPTSDYSVLVKQTDKPITDSSIITEEDTPDPSSNFIINKPGSPYYFSTSTGYSEDLKQYKITNNDKEYNLIDAAKNGVIEPTVKINDRSIDVTTLSTKDLKTTFVEPGDIFSFTDKADSTVSKDGEQINPDFDNGYQFIPKATQALTDAGMSDDEITYVLAQLDDCDPISFYDINATDDQRSACIDSVQLPDDTSTDVSENTLPKTKSLLSNLIPHAEAKLTQSQAVTILKQAKINPKDVPPAILREYINHANKVGNDSWWGRAFGTDPKNIFNAAVGNYKQDIYNDFADFVDNTARKSLPPESRGIMFRAVYHSLSDNHWLNVMQDKNNWESSDLNRLYSVYWYNDPNRATDKFTKEEKLAIHAMWQQGLKDAVENKTVAQREVFLAAVQLWAMVPEFKTAPKPIELVPEWKPIKIQFDGKTVPALMSKAGEAPAVTNVLSKAATGTPRVWGIASEGPNAGKLVMVQKEFNIPTLAKYLKLEKPTVSINVIKQGLHTKTTSLSDVRRLLAYNTKCGDFLMRSSLEDAIAVAQGGKDKAASKIYNLMKNTSVVDGEDLGYAGATHIGEDSTDLILKDWSWSSYRGIAKGSDSQTIFHEYGHHLPKNILQYDAEYSQNAINKMGKEVSYSFFEELHADLLAKTMQKEMINMDMGVVYNYEGRISRALGETLEEIHPEFNGRGEAELLDEMTRYGLKDGVNYSFNSIAKKRLGKQMESAGVDNFHDLLHSQLKNVRYGPGTEKQKSAIINKVVNEIILLGNL